MWKGSKRRRRIRCGGEVGGGRGPCGGVEDVEESVDEIDGVGS
jgi:hypothetical protein